MTEYDQDQQLFTDIILKLQIHSALAEEKVKSKNSPIPLLAQSCSILDNVPSQIRWTPDQVSLINSLKLDAWLALADAYINANDLIQAEAALHRLSTLQDAAAGPFSLRVKKASKNQSPTHSLPLSSSESTDTNAKVTEQRKVATDLVQTLEKMRQVYTDMGKYDMANNFERRAEKMRNNLIERSIQ
ncbi:hypothetical protein BGZ76_003633 [Entomortierella beljakovae]|nr:hypothetical protein BGZ76_003633 [Entomortierella beljakovae]